MVHILLGIVKVIGIVLAAVLGLLLFIFLIVLFGPIGYEAEGRAEETKAVEGRVSWLWFLIHCKVRYDSQNGVWWNLRILGIPLFSSEKQSKKEAAKKKKRASEQTSSSEKQSKKEATKKKKGVPEQTSSSEKREESQKETLTKEKKESPKETSVEEKKAVAQESIAKETQEVPATSSAKENAKKGKIQKKSQPIWKRMAEKIKNLGKKIKSIPQKIQGLRDKGRQMVERFQEIRDYFLGERNKEVIKNILAVLKKMVRHILPRKFRGRVEFGLEDPYVMGQILALLGMLMPLYQDKLEVYPDFEEEKLKGYFSCKGRIIPGYLLFYVLKLLLNKEVRRVIKEGKALIGGN